MKKLTKSKLKTLYDQGYNQGEIAKLLNKDGYRTGWGNEFTRASVGNAARSFGLRKIAKIRVDANKNRKAKVEKPQFCKREVVIKLLNTDIGNDAKADIIEAIYK